MPASTRDRLAQKVAAKKAKVKADVKADEKSGDGSWFWPVVILVLALWIGLFFLDTGGDIEEGSLYNTLGVEPTASKASITKAFRKLAVKWCVQDPLLLSIPLGSSFFPLLVSLTVYSAASLLLSHTTVLLLRHPDKNPNCEECVDTFRTISEAAAVLTDEKKRGDYDNAFLGKNKGGDAKAMGPSEAIELTNANAEALLFGSDRTWLVMVYDDADWLSGHVAPHFEECVVKLNGIVDVGRISKRQNEVIRRLGITAREGALPTFFTFSAGELELYHGQRMALTSSKLEHFVLTSIPSSVTDLNKDSPEVADTGSLSAWMDRPENSHAQYVAVILRDKPGVPTFCRLAALKLRKYVAFAVGQAAGGKGSSGDTPTVKAMAAFAETVSVSSFPSLVILRRTGDVPGQSFVKERVVSLKGAKEKKLLSILAKFTLPLVPVVNADVLEEVCAWSESRRGTQCIILLPQHGESSSAWAKRLKFVSETLASKGEIGVNFGWMVGEDRDTLLAKLGPDAAAQKPAAIAVNLDRHMYALLSECTEESVNSVSDGDVELVSVPAAADGSKQPLLEPRKAVVKDDWASLLKQKFGITRHGLMNKLTGVAMTLILVGILVSVGSGMSPSSDSTAGDGGDDDDDDDFLSGDDDSDDDSDDDDGGGAFKGRSKASPRSPKTKPRKVDQKDGQKSNPRRSKAAQNAAAKMAGGTSKARKQVPKSRSSESGSRFEAAAQEFVGTIVQQPCLVFCPVNAMLGQEEEFEVPFESAGLISGTAPYKLIDGHVVELHSDEGGGLPANPPGSPEYDTSDLPSLFERLCKEHALLETRTGKYIGLTASGDSVLLLDLEDGDERPEKDDEVQCMPMAALVPPTFIVDEDTSMVCLSIQGFIPETSMHD